MVSADSAAGTKAGKWISLASPVQILWGRLHPSGAPLTDAPTAHLLVFTFLAHKTTYQFYN
jgi:hypothetical protein